MFKDGELPIEFELQMLPLIIKGEYANRFWEFRAAGVVKNWESLNDTEGLTPQ